MTTHITNNSDGTFYGTQDAFIQEFDIIMPDGSKFPLKKFIVEFSYYEDLYSCSVTGYVTLRDGVGIIENHKLTGKERVNILFGKAQVDQKEAKEKRIGLRLYKIGTRKPTGNMTSEFYTLYFCSEELEFSQQTKISKSFKGKAVSEIVEYILSERLKVPKENYNIEKTVGVYDLIVPNLSPFESINWLATYARPTSTNLIGADMLFFQNRQGFNFRSLNSMMEQPITKTYRYQQNNLKESSFIHTKELSSVLAYEVIKSADTLKDITQGTYANRVITVDPLRRKYEVVDFDYGKYSSDIEPMNGNGIPLEQQNRDGKLPNEAYESTVRVVYGTSQQNEKEDIKSKDGSVTKDMYEAAVLSHRSTQISLANHNVIKLMVPGDTDVKVGDTVFFNIRSIIPNDSRPADTLLTGKYLVTAVRHILQSQGVFQTVLEISKNGYVKSLRSGK